MKTVSAMTMRRHFGGVLDDVRLKSEKIVIERDGKPVAMLGPLPAAEAESSDKARRLTALERLRGLSRTTARGRSPGRWLKKERAQWTGRER